jgi:hypothetical protein
VILLIFLIYCYIHAFLAFMEDSLNAVCVCFGLIVLLNTVLRCFQESVFFFFFFSVINNNLVETRENFCHNTPGPQTLIISIIKFPNTPYGFIKVDGWRWNTRNSQFPKI